MDSSRRHGTNRRRLSLQAGLLLLMFLDAPVASGQESPPSKEGPLNSVQNRTASRRWQLSDFEAELDQYKGVRSFERGRIVFEAALCAICHRIGNDGGDLGPSLSQPEKPRTRRELLREILDPSRDIEPKYRTFAVTTVDGVVIPGLITSKTERQVTIRTRPVGAVTSRTIAREDIESIEPIDLSMMPDELTSRLTGDEVLDLLAYVESKGDPKSPLFRQP